MEVVGRLSLVLLGIAIGLGATEASLRLMARLHPAEDLRGLHEPRPDRPWLYGLRPGAEGRVTHTGAVRYVINADGFRDRLYPRAKPPGTFRIVVIGDSIAFGYGVELQESFPKLLEARLRARTDTAIEVLNLGVNGYNSYTEAALFADVGIRYQPDLVLVEFCINDLNDPTLHFDTQTLLLLGNIPDAAFPDPQRRREPAGRPSVAFRACLHLRSCVLLLGRLAPPPADGAALAAALKTHDDPSDVELAWLRDRYLDIAGAARAVGARLAIVVFPYATQVDGRVSDVVERRLGALGDAGGWATIDLLPAFRGAAAGGSRPLFIDLWHPNAAGHAVAAEALAAQLSCRGLVPAPPGEDCSGPASSPITAPTASNHDAPSARPSLPAAIPVR